MSTSTVNENAIRRQAFVCIDGLWEERAVKRQVMTTGTDGKLATNKLLCAILNGETKGERSGDDN